MYMESEILFFVASSWDIEGDEENRREKRERKETDQVSWRRPPVVDLSFCPTWRRCPSSCEISRSASSALKSESASTGPRPCTKAFWSHPLRDPERTPISCPGRPLSWRFQGECPFRWTGTTPRATFYRRRQIRNLKTGRSLLLRRRTRGQSLTTRRRGCCPWTRLVVESRFRGTWYLDLKSHDPHHTPETLKC